MLVKFPMPQDGPADADYSALTDGAQVQRATLKIFFVYAHRASGQTEAWIDRPIRAAALRLNWTEMGATATMRYSGAPWPNPLLTSAAALLPTSQATTIVPAGRAGYWVKTALPVMLVHRVA